MGDLNNNLLISDKNLINNIKLILSKTKKELIIFSPYIKLEALKYLLEDISNNIKVTIITTWKLRDLQQGFSDLRIWEFCKKNNYILFLNQNIHLKSLIIDFKKCIFGSANITNKGLAIGNKYNFELVGTYTSNLKDSEIIYFQKILNSSVLMDNKLYFKFKEELSKLKPIPQISEVEIEKNIEKEFLISSLPMSTSVEKLYELYSNNFNTFNEEEKLCAIHDISLYDIPNDLNKEEFKKYISKKFFESLFIQKLLIYIGDEIYWGRMLEWIQKNCSNVPIPSRRSLKENIKVLYKWIVDLSNNKYLVDRPNYSERLYKAK